MVFRTFPDIFHRCFRGCHTFFEYFSNGVQKCFRYVPDLFQRFFKCVSDIVQKLFIGHLFSGYFQMLLIDCSKVCHA